MPTKETIFDVVIVGGGLAGLSLSILLAQKNYSVLLIEKKSYPYHKVCGEYISNESRDFLIRLGIPVNSMDLPQIQTVQLTGVKGQQVSENMRLGGFGISRYCLDQLLAEKAIASGVHLLQATTCHKYSRESSLFEIASSAGTFRSKVLVGSFGRHASGNFFKSTKESENWIGVKYHIQYAFPDDCIALHAFKDGYCGISKIEGQQYCLCYLVRASLLNSYHNNIQEMEKGELYKNPVLHDIFSKATFLFEKPVTVSNITFDAKKPVVDDVFYLGDSAGAIAPLTGNGMSNAMRSAWLLSKELADFLEDKISFTTLKHRYEKQWNLNFKNRIRSGKFMQHFFCNSYLTPTFLYLLKISSYLRKIIIKQAHGKPF
ncbi:MAG: NAD(P)/FAD-dependent oxidoreductase [Bacteroidetes bacterium]|nr:NAD(P)/FAD-dependent oxidoreductase [Bacteroidota bacterium]